MTTNPSSTPLGEESAEWRNMEDFATGIDTNRLPRTHDLDGQTVEVVLAEGGSLGLRFDGDHLDWTATGVPWSGEGSDEYEEVRIKDGVHWVNFPIASRTVETVTVALSQTRGWALVVHSTIGPEDFTTETRVTQSFHPGVVAGAPTPADIPAPTRELIGKRTLFRYSPHHLYEHIYLSSRRFVWHNLIGEQRGHAAAELATTYRLDDEVYLFTWREAIIPVGTVFVFDYAGGRSTGTFIGLRGDGAVANSPGGAYIIEFGRSDYSAYAEPV